VVFREGDELWDDEPPSPIAEAMQSARSAGRYSIFLLYWYKSASSDAEGAHKSTRCMVRRACAILMPPEEPGSARRYSKKKKNLLYWYKSAHSAPYLHALLRGAPSVRDTDAAKGVLKEARAGTVLTFTCFTGTKAQNSDAKAHKAFSRRQLP
jgi:hypothetical protein